MYELDIERKWKITEQTVILHATTTFYKHLYTARNTDNISLDALFTNCNIPKLS